MRTAFDKGFLAALLFLGCCSVSQAQSAEFNFRGPFGIAVNSKDVVYVAEIDNRRISKFSKDGKWLGNIEHVEGYGDFKGPFDVAIGPSDDIYITDCFNNKILILNADETLKLVLGKDVKGSEPGAFSQPHFITVNKKGEIFVADTFNARVQKFSPTGKFLAAWGKVGAGNGEYLQNGYLACIALDGKGNLYVREFDGGRIQKYTEDGEYLATISRRGTEPGELDEGYGLSFIDGKLICPDTFESRVQLFDTEGKLIEVWDPGEGSGKEQFNHPVDIAQLSDGSLVMTDWKNDRVVRLSSEGTALDTWEPSAADRLAYEVPEKFQPPKRSPVRFGVYASCDKATVDACHQSGVELIYYSPNNRDAEWGLAGAIEYANSLGIEVHPSIGMLVFGQDNMKFINAHPELTLWKKGALEPMKNTLSWAQPEARRYRTDHLVDQAKKNGVDGIMLDYIRYLGTEYGYDPLARDEFFKKYGVNPLSLPQDDLRWMQFRADYVTKYISNLRHELAVKLDKHIDISVYLSGDDPAPEKYLKKSLQDWRTWARMGIVDKVNVAWYTRDFDQIYTAVRRVRKVIPDRVKINCFIACYGGNLNTPELLKKGYQVAIDAGSDEVTLYRGDTIHEQNAWGTIAEVIQEYKASQK